MLSAFYKKTGYWNEQNTSANPGKYTVVYSLPVDVQAGDVIVATAEEEFTNNSPTTNAFCSTKIILGVSPTDTVGVNDGWISHDNGLNITPAVHHYTQRQTGMQQIAESGAYHVNYIVYWDPDLTTAGTIESHYGQLAVLILRGATPI